MNRETRNFLFIVSVIVLAFFAGWYYNNSRKNLKMKETEEEIKQQQDSIEIMKHNFNQPDPKLTQATKDNNEYQRRLAELEKLFQEYQNNFDESVKNNDDVLFDPDMPIDELLRSMSRTVNTGRDKIYLHDSTQQVSDN